MDIRRTVMLLVLACGLILPAASLAGDAKPGLFPRNAFNLAYQIQHVEYEESGLMQETGWLQGLAGGFETRVADTVMLRAEAELLAGGLDYDGHYSDGSPASTHTDDWIFGARGLIGRDFKAGAAGLTPFAGLGYRYWNDQIRSAGGYEREITYWYVPLGLEAAALSGDGQWRVGARAEYDLFLRGHVTSHLGDAVAGLDTVENDQDSGWGLRASVFAERAMGQDWSLSVEPFFRYWDIAKSDEDTLSANGRIVGRAWEPANTTTVWGLRLGARY